MINTKRLTAVSVLILLLAAAMAAVVALTPPGQFDRAVDRAVSALEKNGPSDLTLAVVTDLHYDPHKDEPPTVTQTFSTLRKIMDRLASRGLRIDALWNLGDFINGHDTAKAEAAEQIRTVLAAQGKATADYHNITGNHDNNIQSTYASNAGLPESEIFSVAELNALLENTGTLQAEHHSESRLTDYYVDFPTVRAVCLSADGTAFMPETAEWLRNEALATDHEVLVFAHIPTRPEWGFRDDVVNGEAVERALTDFIAAGGTVIAYIHGHDHGDMISTVTAEDGTVLFHEIAVGCARFSCSTLNGTPGMAFRERNENDETMILFDIVTVDQAGRTVRLTRVGAGEDREIIY